MRILLTGATGFVGQALCRAAAGRHEIVAVGRSTPDLGDQTVEWIEADLASADLRASLPAGVDAVIHLAQSRQSHDFPRGAQDMVAVNVGSTATLLDHACSCGVERFVFASTATVYRQSQEPLAEDAPLDCSDFYPATKRCAEILIDPYSELFNCWVMRLFTVYGEGQHGRLISKLAERVRAGDPVDVGGEDGLLLSPIHVDDVAAALLAAAETETGGRLINVGGAETLSIAEIAGAIGNRLGVQANVRSLGGDDPGGYVADRSTFVEEFGTSLEPRRFHEGIAKTLVPA